MHKLLISLCFLEFLLIVAPSVYATDGEKFEGQSGSETAKVVAADPSLNIVLSNNYIHLSDEVSRLESMVHSQNKVIEELQNQLLKKSERVDKNIDFPVLTSFLLGASTLITAGVGIGVAILSFFGYQEILNKGTTAAKLTAETVATEIAAEKIDSEIRTKALQAINDSVESGLFDEIIDERIAKMTFRGVSDVSTLESMASNAASAPVQDAAPASKKGKKT